MLRRALLVLCAVVAAATAHPGLALPPLTSETAQACTRELAAGHVCIVPGFMDAATVASVRAHMLTLAPAISDKVHTLTQQPTDPSLPADHPRKCVVAGVAWPVAGPTRL